MAKVSAKIALVHANNEVINKYEPNPIGSGTNILQNGILFFRVDMGSTDYDKIYEAVGRGGQGYRFKVTYNVFHRKQYASDEPVGEGELDHGQAEFNVWKEFYKQFNITLSWDDITHDHFPINITIVEQGWGYGPKDTLDFGPFYLKFEEMNFTGAIPDFLTGPTNSYWQNNFINPHKSAIIIRNLRETRQIKLDQSGHKFESCHGWKYLFTAGSPSEKSYAQGYNDSDTRATQFKTQNQIAASQAVVFGHALAHQVEEKQRWSNPRGIQFCWSDKHSKDNSKGLSLHVMHLLYKFGDEKITRYAPLIMDGNFANDGEYRGDNPFIFHKGEGSNGFVRTFLSDDDYEYLTEKRAAAIGIYIVYKNAGQSAVYNNYMNYFNFRFLFNKESFPRSRVIVSAPNRMIDYQTSGFRIA